MEPSIPRHPPGLVLMPLLGAGANNSRVLIMQETTMPVPTAVTVSAITLLGLTWRHET